MVKYVKQEQKYGCVFACIAMILGKDYWEIRNDFPKGRFGKEWGVDEGIASTFDGVSYMFYKGGYSHHTVGEVIGYTQEKQEPEEWIKEFAPVHIVSLVLNGYSHACVWEDGIIYDPYREGIYKITDYEKINSITGFWNIKD
jgi:hypothetical protein